MPMLWQMRAVVSRTFYGKPFADVFDLVMQRARGIPRHRIAMVGDTLHTDILGWCSRRMANCVSDQSWINEVTGCC